MSDRLPDGKDVQWTWEDLGYKEGRDDIGYSLVTCQRGRGKKFKEFCIKVNNDWLPEIIDNPEGESWV